MPFHKPRFATGYGAASSLAVPPNTTVTQGQNAKSFYWEFDSYLPPTFSACDDCDPYPNNSYNPVSLNAPQPGVTFYYTYNCTVTP
jgi:hypothetical protein